MRNRTPLVEDWAARRAVELDTGIWSGRHRLHKQSLFETARIARLIDNHPRSDLHIHSMAGNSEMAEYMDIDVGGLSGHEVLQVIARGRIWLSVVDLQLHHAEYRELVSELYAELQQRCEGFRPSRLLANLLISSPTADVFFHADANPGLLWQLRGTKRVFVYPPWDDRFLSPQEREKCLAGMLVDDVYRPEFDRDAAVAELGPGDFLCWPQSTPHRVVNVQDLCMSLATEHITPAAARRRAVASANWWLRRNLGIPCRDTSTRGPAFHAKRLVFSAMRVGAKVLGQELELPEDPPVEPGYRLDTKDARGYSEI